MYSTLLRAFDTLSTSNAEPIDLSIGALFNVKGKIGTTNAVLAHFLTPSRTALVTGGGTGIGKMIASALAQNGATVYIAARKEGQLKAVRSYSLARTCTSSILR